MNSLRADIKKARELLQAGDATASLNICQSLLKEHERAIATSSDSEKQIICALLLTTGMASLAAKRWEVGASSFERVTLLQPDLPQAWKGLIDCLTEAGNENELVNPLLRMASIAQSKKNWGRARTLILRALHILMEKSGGSKSQALDALNMHLLNSEAIETDSDSPLEQFELTMRAAILSDPGSNLSTKYFNLTLRSENLISEHCQAPLRDIFIEAYVKHSYSIISRETDIEGKVEHWKTFLNHLVNLHQEGFGSNALKSATLRGYWYTEFFESEKATHLLELAAQSTIIEPEKVEASLFLAHKSILMGNFSDADRILTGLFNETASSSDQDILVLNEDWRYLSLRALINWKIGWAKSEYESALNSIEKSLVVVESSATHGLGRPPSTKDFTHDLVLVKANLLMSMGRSKEAILLLEHQLALNLPLSEIKTAQIYTALGNIYKNLGNLKEARDQFELAFDIFPNFPEAMEGIGDLLLDVEGPSKALPFFVSATMDVEGIKRDVKSLANAFLKAGRCKWMLGGEYRSNREGCFASFLNAAKLDPSSAAAFGLLGRWYSEEGNDVQRAAGCLNRALKLDPENEEVGKLLVYLYLKSGNEELALAVCKASIAASMKASWAWAFMGCSYMTSGDLEEAASHFQQALAGNPTDWNLWGDLGWTYHRQEKQQAAIKAYARAIILIESKEDVTISESSKTAISRLLTELGRAYQEIGQVDEAVDNLAHALELTPNDPLARLRGGQAALAQAHARASEGLYSSSALSLQRGVCLLNEYLVGNDCKVGWKLLGDLRVCAHRLPPNCFGGAGEETLEEFVGGATAAYEGAINVMNDIEGDEIGKAAAHYDLALALLLHARIIRMDFGEGCGLWPSSTYLMNERIALLINRAKVELHTAIKLNPLLSDAWNALGTIAEDFLVQQHCLARATQLDHNPSAWANLAVLYTNAGRDGEAYESLEALQTIVDHPVMWVVLGLLREKESLIDMNRQSQPNELPKSSLVALSQAADAYYASLEATPLLEALAGLSRTALYSHSLFDSLTSSTLLVQSEPNNASAWNLHGSLLECSGRFDQATRAFERSEVLIVRQMQCLGISVLAKSALNTVRRNRARCLMICGKESALAVLNLIDETGEDLQLAKVRALASVGRFDGVMDMLKATDEKEGRGTAATMAYFTGEHSMAVNIAHSLVENFATDLHSLMIGLCVGGVCKDMDLMETSRRCIQGLSKPESIDMSKMDILALYFSLYAGQKASGSPLSSTLRTLCKAAHIFPGEARIWTELAAGLLDEGLMGGDSAFESFVNASECASAAIALMEQEECRTFVRGKVYLEGGGPLGSQDRRAGADILGKAMAIKSCAENAAGVSDGLRDAARAVHIYPGSADSWNTLKLAVECSANLNKVTSKKFSKLVRSSVSINTGTLNRARHAAVFDRDVELAIELYKSAIRESPHVSFQWQQLSLCYQKQGYIAAAKCTLECAIKSCRGVHGGLNLLLAELLKSSGEPELALERANKALVKAKGEWIPSVAEFFIGVLFRAMGKEKQANKYFEKCMKISRYKAPTIPLSVYRQYVPEQISEQ